MAGSALRKITTEAKKIYKRGGSWKSAIKKAGAEYRSGKLGKVVHMKTRRKRATAKRKRVIKKIHRLHRAEGKAIRKLGSVENATAAALRNALVKKVKEKLAGELLARDLAKTKTEKRRITKQINLSRRYIKRFE